MTDVVVALVASPFTAIALFFAFDKSWLWSLLMFAMSFMLWRFDSLRLVARNEVGVAAGRA